MTPLLKELRFYVAPKLSDADEEDLKQLIEQNGGVISNTPTGATQLVDYDKLDARHPEQISSDFIKDSVAFRALQDPAKYSGKIFMMQRDKRGRKRRGRIPYTLEDDARMLHFAKSRDWKSMNSVPASVWKLAESDRVTLHPALSMHEHFRKKLQRKTPIEQRIIMAKAAAIIRAKLLEQETETETATTPESSTIEARLKEVEKEKFSGRTRRKQTAPQREVLTQISPGTFATPSTPPARSTPARSSSSVTPRTSEDQHKRKRNSPSSVTQDSNARRQESDDDSVERNRGGEFGIYFRCAWTELAQDQSKRRLLQRLFEPTPAPPPQQKASSTDSVVSDQDTAILEEADNSENGIERMQTSVVQVEYATEKETDQLICQLQVDTHAAMPSVVHALYYCSGDVEMARTILKGASASEMWSPEDDLLLVNLVAEENIDRSKVDAAVARGDFDSMQVPRDTNAILKRVQFLR